MKFEQAVVELFNDKMIHRYKPVRFIGQDYNYYMKKGVLYKDNMVHEFVVTEGFSKEDMEADDWVVINQSHKFDWAKIICDGCLCYFWNDDESDGVYGKLGYIKDEQYVINDAISPFKNCRPVTKNEITFYRESKPYFKKTLEEISNVK